jgi:SRSO17 transposase
VASTPNFLNHNTVVLFAFAVADTRFKHSGMDLKKRQLLSELARLVHHQMRVFERLAYAAFRCKIADDHFRPFGVHHLRSGC